MDNENRVSRRNFLQRLSLFGVAGLGAGTVLSACGGGGDDGGGTETATEGSEASAESGDVAKSVTLHPEGNQMRYQETEFTVPAGEQVEIVFDNTATSPSMQHNVVVLNVEPSDEVFQRVGQAGAEAGAKADYVPDDPAIHAATEMSQPGETVSVTFTTPSEPGDYGYVCTYPGHWATMQGTMHVEA